MAQQIGKHKFDNLQPITFLRKFNKMIQDDNKHPLKQYKNELRVIPLSKFPEPIFYLQMQGIFETGTKKKDLINFNSKPKDQIIDQQFLEKHKNFMSKAIQKIIKQNEIQQYLLQKQKRNYEPLLSNGNFSKRAKKSLSQPKFQLHMKIKNIQDKTQNIKQFSENQIQSKKKLNSQSPEQVINLTYLQKVKNERFSSINQKKYEKYRIKDNKKIKQQIQAKKKCFSARKVTQEQNISKEKQIKTARPVQYNNINSNDLKKQFIANLINLQQEQTKFQHKYSSMIEEEIKKYEQKVKQSIQRTKKQKFW